MRKTLPLYLLLLSGALAAQSIHEVKIDLVQPFIRGLRSSYEYNPRGNWGIELDGRFRWKLPGEAEEVYLAPAVPEAERRITKALTLTLAGKWYGPRNKSGSRFYAGAYVRKDWLLSPLPTADRYQYYFLYNYHPYDFRKHGRNLWTGLGLLGGYKWMITPHWLLEACVGVDLDPSRQTDLKNAHLHVNTLATLKTGYRW